MMSSGTGRIQSLHRQRTGQDNRASVPVQKMLKTDRYVTIKESAMAEKISPSCVSRVLRLKLLSPTIVEVILEGRSTAGLTLAEAMKVFPVVWRLQQGHHLSA